MTSRIALFALIVLFWPMTGMSEELELEKGPIQTLREPLRMLLKLSWEDDQLAIDRDHWNEADVEIPEDDPRLRLPERFRDRILDKSKAAVLFGNLKNKAGAGSGGSGGGNEEFSGRGYGETVEMTIDGGPTHFRFKITERTGPGRTLEVRCDQSTVTQISVVGPLAFHLRQTADGRVAIVEAFDDQVHRYEGESFAALCHKYPAFVRDRFFPALDQLGMIVPPVDPTADESR